MIVHNESHTSSPSNESVVERLVLTGRVESLHPLPPSGEEYKGGYVAWVDGLDLRAEGESADVAREELVQAMITWISAMDCSDSMSAALTEAGYPEIDEETELHLEFACSLA